MKINYIVPAGGAGNRFGSEIPKQFIKLSGIPIIIRTIQKILSHKSTARVVVPMNAQWRVHFDKLISQWDLDGIEITDGGESRHSSILSALDLLKDATGYIAIHDAVRPLFTNDLIDRLIDNLELTGSSIPVLPVVDTIKCVNEDKGVIERTIDRRLLRAAQTPQMFNIADYLESIKNNSNLPTDDSSILESAGFMPSYVRGEERNIKITTPHDMLLAELLLKSENK